MSSCESVLIGFLLSGVGEDEEAEHSLLGLCETGKPLPREVVDALTVSPSWRVREVLNVMISEGEGKLPPNAASKHLLETVAKRGDEWLMASVGLAFWRSFEKWYDEYLPYLEQLILTSEEATYRALLGLGIGLEHVEQFFREDTARWLAPDNPRLWPLIWRMFLTHVGHLKEIPPLLELARRHSDQKVRDWGEWEISLLKEEEAEAPYDAESFLKDLRPGLDPTSEEFRSIKQILQSILHERPSHGKENDRGDSSEKEV